MRNLPGVVTVHAAVQPAGPHSVCALAAEHAGGREVDLLSIDVDGLDYDLLASLAPSPTCRPKACRPFGSHLWSYTSAWSSPPAAATGARPALPRPGVGAQRVGRGARR